MKNIAVGVQGLDGVGTIMQVSQGIWSHAHIKLDTGKIKFGDEPVAEDEDKLGPESECCFFMTGQGASESFLCGDILRVVEAPMDEQMRYRIEFELLKKTIREDEIENFDGLTHGQHHVYY